MDLEVNTANVHPVLVELGKNAAIDDILCLLVLLVAGAAFSTRGLLWAKPDPYQKIFFERPQLVAGSAQAGLKKQTLAQKIQETSTRFLILWGSQSGTGERFAARLGKELTRRFGYKSLVVDVGEYDPVQISDIPGPVVTFLILSTYGEGDPSDNTAALWDWLGATSESCLTSLSYFAIGLGNKHYKHYNKVVDVVVEKLNALGARQLLPTGKADDSQGQTEEHFITWKDTVFQHLSTQCGLEEKPLRYEPSIKVEFDTSLEPIDLHHGAPSHPGTSRMSMAVSRIEPLPLTNARNVFSGPADRTCLHMELDLSHYVDMKYQTGDHLAIWPSNPVWEVKTLVSALSLESQLDTPLLIHSIDSETTVKVPSPTSLRALLDHYVEICAPISSQTVTDLIEFAPTSAARSYLTELIKDRAAFDRLLASRYLNIGRLLALAAPSTTWAVPLSFLVECLPSMRPRYYSISSASSIQPRTVSITALVSNKSLNGGADIVPGLCSNHLLGHSNSLASSAQVNVQAHIRRSAFHLPTSPTASIVMIAAGTGIAPFRAFIQERHRMAKHQDIGKLTLIYGCRNTASDYPYRDEIETMQKDLGHKFEVVTAVSRPSFGKKQYVQDCIRSRNGDVARDLVDLNKYMFICGGASMGRDVMRAIGDVVRDQKRWSEEQWQNFETRQKRSRRWAVDVWG